MAQQWKAPSYATPSDEWTPPDYAVPDEVAITIQGESSIEEKPIIEPEPIVEPTPEQQTSLETLRNLSAMGIRGITAFAPGGPVGALAGGLGEIAAQTIEPRESYNIPQVVTQAGLGAIPFGRVASIGRGMLKGATMGATGTTATELAETGELPSIEQLALGIGIGSIGGSIAGIRPPRLPKIADDVASPNAIPAPMSNVRNLNDIASEGNRRLIKNNYREWWNENVEPSVINASPIRTLEKALKEGFEKVKVQTKSYTDERRERIFEAKSVDTKGEQGFFEQLNRLKGEYKKEGIPPLREVVSKDDIDELYNLITSAPINDEFTKIHAKSGLLKLLNGDVPQQNELDLLNHVFKTEIELPNAALKPKTINKAKEIWELSRGLMSVDVPFMTSAAFRQAAPMAGTPNWFKSFANASKSFTSSKVYDTIMQANDASIIHKPRSFMNSEGKLKTRSIAEEIGLARSSLKAGTREESFRSTLAEKVPLGYGKWVRASNRAQAAFLNTLRTRTVEDWLKAHNAIDSRGNLINVYDAKKIANTINDLTGHGNFAVRIPGARVFSHTAGKEYSLERAGEVLSTTIFSPRLMARDARMLNPLNYVMTDKFMRKEYLAGAIRRAGVWASFTTLGALAGAEVINDITNSDFGKAKIGDTRLDAGSGLLQWIVLSGRNALGEYTSSSKPNRPIELGSTALAPTRGSLVADFLINRLHPNISYGAEALRASEYRPFNVGSETAEKFMPMFSGDLIEIFKSDPELAEIFLGLVGASTSMGTMNYGPSKEPGEPTINIPGDVKFEGGSFFK